MKSILVTGSTGFVGRHLCESLSQKGYRLRAALRKDQTIPGHIAEKIVVGELSSLTEWADAVGGVDYVIHCAARAHVIGSRHDETAYMEANALATERLAQCCADRGVRRVIYLSSVKVNGEETTKTAFSSRDRPNPMDPYAVSKWIGEKRLLEVAKPTAMETAIVRSPLVYGPGVKANFLRLMQWVDSGVPLPFGVTGNARSLVSVWNLCDLIGRLLLDSVPKHGLYMVADGEDLSTFELIRRIGLAMGRRTSLLPIPVPILRALGALCGRRSEIDRLCGSLRVDIALTCSQLSWAPPVSVDDSLKRTVDWYLARQKAS
jgi:nucleoside-diphosphate-sugar epimerase